MAEYDDVSLLDATEISLGTGEKTIAPVSSRATILFFVDTEAGALAALEVYPDGDRFGFVELSLNKIEFLEAAGSKSL
ncbi:MAG: hypothetical protein AAFS03_08055 [Pseudomonadota bacterium]